jgi:hypothetical protein
VLDFTAGFRAAGMRKWFCSLADRGYKRIENAPLVLAVLVALS